MCRRSYCSTTMCWPPSYSLSDYACYVGSIGGYQGCAVAIGTVNIWFSRY